MFEVTRLRGTDVLTDVLKKGVANPPKERGGKSPKSGCKDYRQSLGVFVYVACHNRI
jgi:hypothetical protein